jgi:hypothetical protein
MARFEFAFGNSLARKSLRYVTAALAALLVGIALAPGASAQTANLADTWKTDCEAGNCVTYFMTAGVQIFIGTEAGGTRELADIRVLPNSVPGTPVTLRLDTGWSGGMVINECNETYCNFILDLSAAPGIVNQFKAAGSGMLAYVITNGETSQIALVPFHLQGFTAAYDQRSGG